MKKTLAILLFVFIGYTVNAQWYYNHYSVTNINDLSESQLNLALEKADKSIKTGQLLTGAGVLGVIVGTVIYSNGIDDILDYSIESGVNKGVAGAYIMYGGAAMAGVGIPVWVLGKMKKNDIEVALVKYKSVGFAPNVGVGIRIKI